MRRAPRSTRRKEFERLLEVSKHHLKEISMSIVELDEPTTREEANLRLVEIADRFSSLYQEAAKHITRFP